jgi:hypothetical protein
MQYLDVWVAMKTPSIKIKKNYFQQSHWLQLIYYAMSDSVCIDCFAHI